jgi:hypothetical protein
MKITIFDSSWLSFSWVKIKEIIKISGTLTGQERHCICFLDHIFS